MAVLCCCRGEKYRSTEGRIETPHPRFPTRRARPLANGPRGPPCLRPSGTAADGPVDAKVLRGARHEVPLEEFTLDPAVLDVDDSDEENDGGRRVTKNSSTSTLEGLKARFVRRLSQQTEPRSQVQHASHTEEELARRAELKRIRHRRIQEELQMDREAESRNETPCRPASVPKLSGELPRVGPRDMIEFGVGPVGESHPAALQPLHVPAVCSGPPITEESVANLTRWRSSCSEPTTRPLEHPSAAPRVHIRPMCSLPRLPSSSPLKSVPLSGDDASLSVESWRLSYSAGNIVISQEEDQPHGHQRISAPESSKGKTQSQVAAAPDVESNRDTISLGIGPDSQKETPHGEAELTDTDAATKTASVKDVVTWSLDEAADSDSPLDLWLRVQAKALAPDESQRQTNDVFNGRSPVAPSSTVSHHGIGRGGVLPLTQGSTRLNDSVLLSAPGIAPMNRGQSQTSSRGSSEKLQNDGALFGLDGRPPHPWLAVPDSQNSTRPSNNKNSSSFSHLDGPGHFSLFQGIAKPQPQNCTVTPNQPGKLPISDALSYKTAPAKATTPESAVIHLKGSPRRPTLDTRSLTGFETANFKLREAELDSVARRFVLKDTPRVSRTPFVSKFREEFDRDNVAKSNLFARFRISKKTKLPRRRLVKGPPAEKGPHRNCVADALDASHLAAAQSRSRSASPRSEKADTHNNEPNAADSVTYLWQRAVRLEVDRREALRRDKERYTNRYDGGHQDEDSEKATVRSVSALSFLKESSRLDRQGPYHLAERYNNGPSRGKTTVGPDFSLHRTGRKPILPGAWVKWPSHTRAERNGSAGKSDNVTPKDFATIGEPTAGNRPAIPPRPLIAGSLARAFRNSISKIKPDHDVSPKSWKRLAREQEERHQKHVGDLEYPEVELPQVLGSIEELQALEQQINRIKHHTGSPDGLSSHNAETTRRKSALSLRLAQDIQQLRHEDEDVTAQPYEVLNSGSPKSLMASKRSPAGSGRRHVSTATIDHFLTPTSHLSYEDSIPNQAIDDHGEGDSVKSDSSILVRRCWSDVEHQGPSCTPKYLTWSGRAKTQPVLLKSTQEFGAELERMMAQERNKIMGSGPVDDE